MRLAWFTMGLCLLALGQPVQGGAAAPIHDRVKAEAEALAAKPYDRPADTPPAVLGDLTYVQHREIEFNRDHTLFRGSGAPFEAQFYHRGGVTPGRVGIVLVDPDSGAERAVDYDPGLFNFRNAPVQADDPQLAADLGFAGLKLLAPLNRPADQPYDEVMSFLGASYFRAVGRDQVYGTSARGLAIDTLQPDRGEEFPAFVRFHIVEPRPGDKVLDVVALLDSPAVCGAYRFTIRPGDDTVVGVEADLFFRHGVSEVGLAPLTSMYHFGENDTDKTGDYRPEVHDADGLLVRAADGDTWRPLLSPDHPRVTDVTFDRMVGFGLMQRDRDFDHYHDDEAAYHRRPSVWVRFDEPVTDGVVRLVELPTNNEYMDNVVAYWRPARAPRAGDRLTLGYELVFTTHPLPPADDAETSSDVAHVTATRYDRTDPSRLRVLIDFTGPALSQHVTPKLLGVPQGEIESVVWAATPMEQTWRLSFLLKDQANPPRDLRVRLEDRGRVISETWSGTWK